MQKNLPEILPIFPLSNFILFPKTSVPLNIFEPRYIQMINDSLKKDKLIGIIQPKNTMKNLDEENKELFSIGCAGRITNFKKTSDNRIVLVLNGISRFKIQNEITNNKLYRECKVNFKQFNEDLNTSKTDVQLKDLELLFKDLKLFFQKKKCIIDWDGIKNQNLNQVINSLCMISPFSLEEKQILLESEKIEDRKIKLKEILNTYALSNIEVNTIQ